ncbi:MAG: transglutaminase domain-containing protein [Candidatus Thorarchaeota archaeon]|nr:MAG: transglutaminase domain-containing protein [Candidatus Thorarchaeota archaeon]
MRLMIDMQATINNISGTKIRDGRMIWHLFTDMGNQFVTSFDVFPPARVVEKAENNMVAVMKVPKLNPGESFSPTVVLRIDTTTRDWLIEPQPLSESEMKRMRGTLTRMHPYWETEDALVQDISQSIAERSNNDESYSRLAYEIVRNTVKLRTHLDHRRGAADAARSKEGDCDEFADLFVALNRAVGIPARRVVGHFYRSEEPEPHAWSEVYLQRLGWVPVDPALGSYGTLNEYYFSRIREGLVSERPTIQLKWNSSGAARRGDSVSIEEEVKMSVLRNGEY